MNKQELIERLEGLKNIFGNECEYVKIDFVIELASELDEPQKPVIPKFVADEIKHFKKTGDWDLFQAMDYCFEKKKIGEWLENKDNQETFAHAWIFGYTIEKEKRYLVKFKKIEKGFNCLSFDSFDKEWKIFNCNNSFVYHTHHTRKQLEEAGFGWVFDCEGIEIEEVEE